jgi:hypothetical protein
LVPVPDPNLSPDYIQQSFSKKLSKILPLNVISRQEHCFLKTYHLIFDFLTFFTFVFHFKLDSEPECIPVPIPLRQKVAVPTVPVQVPQQSIIIVLVVFQLEENPEDCGGGSICEPGESGAEEVRQPEAGGCSRVSSHPRSHSPPGAR